MLLCLHSHNGRGNTINIQQLLPSWQLHILIGQDPRNKVSEIKVIFSNYCSELVSQKHQLMMSSFVSKLVEKEVFEIALQHNCQYFSVSFPFFAADSKSKFARFWKSHIFAYCFWSYAALSICF